jgi:hypothetical protein
MTLDLAKLVGGADWVWFASFAKDGLQGKEPE